MLPKKTAKPWGTSVTLSTCLCYSFLFFSIVKHKTSQNGPFFPGESVPWDHRCAASQTLPTPSQTMQKCQSGHLRKQQNQLKNSKCRAEKFLNDIRALGDGLFCKFCQHVVNWKRVPDTCTCGLMLVWRRKTFCCTHSNATVSVKCF